MSVSFFNLNTPTNLPLVVKEYMCFHSDGKSAQAAKCVKSRKITEVVYFVLSIDKFEQQCVLIKGIL